MNKPIKSWPESVGSAVSAFPSLARKLFTTADPEVKNRAASVSEMEIVNASKRAAIQNFLAIKALLTDQDYHALLQANEANTPEKRAAVIANELRQRGYPVAGETPRLPQRPAPTPAAAAVQLSLPVVPAPAIAADAGPPMITAHEFVRMSVADQKQFIMSGGKMSYAEFSKMTPGMKSFFSVHGGKLTDDMPNARRERAIPETPEQARARSTMPRPFRQDGATKTYAEFSALSAAQKMEFCRNGGRIE